MRDGSITNCSDGSPKLLKSKRFLLKKDRTVSSRSRSMSRPVLPHELAAWPGYPAATTVVPNLVLLSTSF